MTSADPNGDNRASKLMGTRAILVLPAVFLLAFLLTLDGGIGLAVDTPPALLVKEFGSPADEIRLRDGKALRVKPLSIFPRTPPQQTGPVKCELSDKPGTALAIPASDIQAIVYFEVGALDKIEASLQNADDSRLATADEVLQELGHFHTSRRFHSPLETNPWAAIQGRIAAKVHDVRRRRLARFAEAKSGIDWPTALRRADAWLELDPALRDVVRALWVHYGTVKVEEGDWSSVRAILNHIEEHFVQNSQAERVRRALQTRATTLAKEAQGLPDDQAARKLREALALWPHAPGWRDELAKLTKSYGVLYVGVRQLPERLSPATAWTDAERQALDLLFDRLVQAQSANSADQHYEPNLLTRLPEAEGLRRHVNLRRDVHWSDGERLTSNDVRHTAQLLASTPTWRELLEVPRFEGRRFSLTVTSRQGLLDPLAPLGFYVLPRKYRGQPLNRAEDPEFAKAPVGSGPFRYVGPRRDGKQTVAVFQTNPWFEGREPKKRGNVREIRMMAWSPTLNEAPLPHLILRPPPRSVEGLKKLGYTPVESTATRRVYFLAVNHRVSKLAKQDLRRALAHAIPRQQILQDHFPHNGPAGQLAKPLSGPFPAQSWAACQPPRVPQDPYNPDLVQVFARTLGPGSIRLSLKFPADEPGVREACTAIAEHATKLFAEASVKLILDLVPLSPPQMHDALYNRDYELMYHNWDFPDDTFWLWPLFDPHADALRPGGSNFLGYEEDSTLQSLLRSVMSHRQFSEARELQQSAHQHIYERMPLIPLWQLPPICAVHSSLTAPNLDPQRVFANVLQWRVNP